MKQSRMRKILCVFFAVVCLMQNSVCRDRLLAYATGETAESQGESEWKAAAQKPVDIVLSVGSSYLGLETFEDDLRTALTANGVDRSCVNIKTFDGVEISSESADAYSIFTTWTNFPFNKESYWHYDSQNRWITTAFNEAYETGFLDMTSGYVKDFTMKTNVQGPETIQPLGFVFRVRPSEKYAGRWDMYYLWVSADNYQANEKVFAIFKVEGQHLDASKRANWSGTYSATPLMRFNKVYFGWPYHAPYDYGGYPNYTPYQTGITVSNKADPTMKTTTLAIGSIPALANSSWYDLSLNVSGNHYTAKMNGQTILDVIDEENPYTEGYYGIFSYSHVRPKFRDILINQKRYKSLTETITNTEWREESTKILIHLNDKEEEAFSTESSMKSILEKAQEKGIFYVGWGNETNASQNETFISCNGGKGITVDTGDYTAAIMKIANYITKVSRFPEGSGTKEDPYIIRTKEQLSYVHYYLDAYYRLEKDINYAEYSWSPLGTYEAPFTGHIDGNGHVIEHLVIAGCLDNPTGFVGVMQGGSVTDLVLKHVAVNGSDYSGAVIGYAYGGCIIESCIVEEGTIIGGNYTSGLAGYMEDGRITKSQVTASVYGKCYIGGVAGFLSGAMIRDCISFATVTGIQKVGGIVGGCMNTRIQTCMSFATLVGNTMIGGIAGYHKSENSFVLEFQPILADCVSFATVKGERYAGGLVGYSENTQYVNCEDYSTAEQENDILEK